MLKVKKEIHLFAKYVGKKKRESGRSGSGGGGLFANKLIITA